METSCIRIPIYDRDRTPICPNRKRGTGNNVGLRKVLRFHPRKTNPGWNGPQAPGSPLPPRILPFRLRLDRFDYDIKHVPGKELYTADTLSRAPVQSEEPPDDYLQDLTELFVHSTIAHLPASSYRLESYQKAQAEDPVCQQILQFCQTQWPDKKNLEPSLIPYSEQRGTLTVVEGILMQGKRIVVPKSLQLTTLDKLHSGHLGIVRCRLRAKMSVWWPGISKQLAQFVTNCTCPKCARDSRPKKELPDYPWEMIAVPPWRKRLLGDSRLFLTLSGSEKTEIHYESNCH